MATILATLLGKVMLKLVGTKEVRLCFTDPLIAEALQHAIYFLQFVWSCTCRMIGVPDFSLVGAI